MTQHKMRNVTLIFILWAMLLGMMKLTIVWFLETYWAKTQFLTEKSFKPILAQHPFVNIGNGTTQLLKQLGFDVFEDVVNFTASSTQDRTEEFSPITFDIDPRLANNS